MRNVIIKYHLTSSWTFFCYTCIHFHSSRLLAWKDAWPLHTSLHHGVRFEISPLALNSIYFLLNIPILILVSELWEYCSKSWYWTVYFKPWNLPTTAGRAQIAGRRSCLSPPSDLSRWIEQPGLVTLFRSRGGVTPYKGLYWEALPETGIVSVRRVYKRVGRGLDEDSDLPCCNDQTRDGPLLVCMTSAVGHTFASTKSELNSSHMNCLHQGENSLNVETPAHFSTTNQFCWSLIKLNCDKAIC